MQRTWKFQMNKLPAVLTHMKKQLCHRVLLPQTDKTSLDGEWTIDFGHVALLTAEKYRKRWAGFM